MRGLAHGDEQPAARAQLALACSTPHANPASITYYFGSMHALVAEALVAEVERLVEPAMRALEGDGDPVQRLMGAITDLLLTFACEPVRRHRRRGRGDQPVTGLRDLTGDVGGVGGWLRVGALRGAAIGAVTPPVCALMGMVIALTAAPEPLPAGTTTTSTQTSAQALAGLVLLTLYLAIAASVGSVVGAAVGAATAAVAGVLDATSKRRLPAGLLAVVATVAAGWVVQAVAIGWIPTARPLDAGAERAWRVLLACPFLLGLLSLVISPLGRPQNPPHDRQVGP